MSMLSIRKYYFGWLEGTHGLCVCTSQLAIVARQQEAFKRTWRIHYSRRLRRIHNMGEDKNTLFYLGSRVCYYKSLSSFLWCFNIWTLYFFGSYFSLVVRWITFFRTILCWGGLCYKLTTTIHANTFYFNITAHFNSIKYLLMSLSVFKCHNYLKKGFWGTNITLKTFRVQ